MGARTALDIRWTATLGVVLLLASFGSAGLLVPSPAAAQVEVQAVVQLLDALAFDPAVTVVQPNATLSFFLVNDGTLPHTFTLFAEANVTLPLDSEQAFQGFYENAQQDEQLIVDVDVPPGERAWANFTAPETVGTYAYACVVSGHAIGGMHGVLVVGQVGEPGAEPTEAQGVELRSYWIGLIGIFSMIAVIVVAYFVIKYESRHHTDHREHKRRGLP